MKILNIWYYNVKSKEWKSLNDIRNEFNSVDYVGNNRFVFNIKGNKYKNPNKNLDNLFASYTCSIYVMDKLNKKENYKIDLKAQAEFFNSQFTGSD